MSYHTLITISLLAAVIGFLLNSLVRYWQGKISRSTLSQDQEVYAQLNALVQSTSAERVSVWRVENGGGEIKVGQSKYLSNVYEVTGEPLSYTRDMYQRVMLHEFDVRFFAETQKYGDNIHQVNHNNRGVLTDRFRSEGVLYAYAQPIITTSKVAFFLVMETTDTEGLMTSATDRAFFQTSHGKIKSIFENNYGSQFTIKL